MNPTTQKLLQEALGLSDRDRADLAAELLVSLDTNTDDDAEQLWQAEVLKRVAELDLGAVKTIPWTNIRARLLSRTNDSA